MQTTQKMERYEAARLHAERLPEIELKHRNLRQKTSKEVRGIRLVNETPTRYDEWRVQVDLTDPSTAEILAGLLDDDGQVLPEVTITDVDHLQDVDLVVKRVSVESSGDAQFVVIARRGEDEWRVVRRLRFHGPARVF